MRLEYNPITGVLQGTRPSYEFPNSISEATLFTDMNIGACVALIEYSAFQLNSNYNINLVTRQKPIVDGIVLNNGKSGSLTKIASLNGYKYSFSDPILTDNSLKEDLYLSKTGYISLDVPSLLNGDRWSVYIGKRINDYSFIFDPHEPLDLLDPGGIVPPSPYPDPSTDKLIISENMLPLTCFRINSSGEAYKVKADDNNLLDIDGITLESGTIGQQIKVARIKNQIYETSLHFTTSSLYLLNNLGLASLPPRDINAKYSVIVGRSIANSNKFIFDSQSPIKLL